MLKTSHRFFEFGLENRIFTGGLDEGPNEFLSLGRYFLFCHKMSILKADLSERFLVALFDLFDFFPSLNESLQTGIFGDQLEDIRMRMRQR